MSLKRTERGEKSEIIRDLMQKNPTMGNSELAGLFAEAAKKRGTKLDRPLAKIAQDFANKKAMAKRKQTRGTATKRGKGDSSVRGGFTMLDLEAVDALSKRLGGYQPLMELVQFMASRT